MERIGGINSQLPQNSEPIYAVSILGEECCGGVSGVVKMIQQGEIVKIKAVFKGLSTGLHGFHIHQFGNLIEGCKTAGPHFNPTGQSHGGPNDEERHIGDLGNVVAESGKDAIFELIDTRVRLSGPNSVVGRAFVVHADPDDLGRGGYEDSKITGHAGNRLACGIIGLSGPLQL